MPRPMPMMDGDEDDLAIIASAEPDVGAPPVAPEGEPPAPEDGNVDTGELLAQLEGIVAQLRRTL